MPAAWGRVAFADFADSGLDDDPFAAVADDAGTADGTDAGGDPADAAPADASPSDPVAGANPAPGSDLSATGSPVINGLGGADSAALSSGGTGTLGLNAGTLGSATGPGRPAATSPVAASTGPVRSGTRPTGQGLGHGGSGSSSGSTLGGSGSGTASPQSSPPPIQANAYHAVEGQSPPPVETVASFTDTGSGPYGATVSWGDGQSSPGTVVLAQAGHPNSYTVQASHLYADEGNWWYTVTVTGGAHGPIQMTGMAEITDATLTAGNMTVNVVEGTPFTGVLAVFSDGNPTATAADFYILGAPYQVVATSQPGVFDVTGTVTFNEEGAGTVGCTVEDDGGQMVAVTSGVQITDAPISAYGISSPPVQVTEGTTSHNVPVATITDSAPADTGATFSSTVKSVTLGTIFPSQVNALGNGQYQVLADLTYTEEMADTLQITVADDGGATAAAGTSVAVGDAALSWTSGSPTFTWQQFVHPAPSLTPLGALFNAEGDPVSVQVQASGPDGDTLTYDALGLPPGLAIDPYTGLILGVVNYSAAEHFGGVYNGVIVVADGQGGSAFSPFTWTITDTDRPPVLTSPGAQSNARGDTVALQVGATDPDGDQLIYDSPDLPPGLSIDPLTGLISGTIDPTQDYGGPLTVSVTASDQVDTVLQVFSWNVSNANHPPVLTGPGDQTSAGGDNVSLTLSASDADENTLTYFATGLPTGLDIDPSTGAVTGIITPSAASGTPYTVTVTASDGMAPSSQTFRWTVNYVGVQNPGDLSDLTGDSGALPITATSATGAPLTYSASGLPPGLTIDSTTGVISGTISPTAGVAAPYTVTVSASDGSHVGSTTFQWTLAHVGLTGPGDQTGREGASVSLPIQASDADGDALTYTATGLPAGLSINAQTGLISGTPAAGAAVGGPYHVTVAASDGSYQASSSFTWAVTPAIILIPPGDQANVDGDMVSLQLRARDASGGHVGYSAYPLPPGLSIDPNSGLISGTISSTADTGSPYTATVTALDSTYSTSFTITWTVGQILVVNPGDQASTTGDAVSLPIGARAAGGAALTYSATGLPAGLSIDATSGIVSGSVASTADADSPYTVTVTAATATASASQTFTWTVNPHIVVDTPDDQTNAAGDVVSVAVSAFDADGDTLSYSALGLPAGLAMDPASGSITGTLAAGADASSPYLVFVVASDGSRSASTSFTWTVTHVGLTRPSDPISADGRTVSLALQGHDADGDSVTYSATGLPPGLSLNPTTGLISGTLSASAHTGGNYTLTATATDGSESASQTFVWTVTEVGVSSPGDQASTEGDAVSLPVAATTSNGQALTYRASDLPAGLTIDPQTGVISGSLAPGSADGGPYTVTVAADDGSLASSQTFTWTVNPRVVFANEPADQSTAEGSAVSLSVAATDTAGLSLTYTADGLPPGLTINSGTGLISGTIASGASAAAPYTVTVAASDGSSSESVVFGWDISHAEGMGPVLVNPLDQAGTETDPVSLQVAATDADGDPLTFSATGLPAGLSMDASAGIISGTMDTNAASQGPYGVTVTVDDGNGGTASQSFLWVVRPAAITALGVAVSAEEGNQTPEIPLATFTDPNWQRTAEDFVATIYWGDGSSDSGDITATGGSFTVSGSHTYAKPGTFPVTVVILDSNGASASSISTATVSLAPLTATGGLTLSAVPGQPEQFTLGSVTDGNPNEDPSTYTVSIGWGDGSSPGAGQLTEGADGNFIIVGTHTYHADGSYPMTVTVTDAEGSQATATSAVQVDDLWAGAQTQLTVATFTDANPYASVSDYSATVAWGDGHTTPGTVSAVSGGYEVQGLSVYAKPGSYTPGVTVTDDGGSTLAGADPNPVTVVDPPITLHVAPIAATVGALLDNIEVADFTDPNGLETASEFSATISWGDGLSSQGTIIGSNGLFQVFGSHTYTQDGELPVVVGIYWQDPVEVALGAAPAQAVPATPDLSITQHVRDADTPKSMPDRIPPRKAEQIQITIGPEFKGKRVFITAPNRGTNDANGAIDFQAANGAWIGALYRDQPGKYTINIRGWAQTTPGNGGKLTIRLEVDGKVVRQTEPFSVAAIPLSMRTSYVNVGAYRNPRGTQLLALEVSGTAISDSGSTSDLDNVFGKEEVALVDSSGLLKDKLRPQSNPHYGPVPLSEPIPDIHAIPAVWLLRARQMQQPGAATLSQYYLFKDKRTGTDEVPIPQSGYEIGYRLFYTSRGQDWLVFKGLEVEG